MRLFKIPVNVPPNVAQFRAEYSARARWLPPHLANVLIGAICTADARGEDAATTYEAISAATHTPGLQKRYKCKPVSPRQVERSMPVLRELGVLTWHSEKTRVTCWSDHYGEIRSRIYLRLTIDNIEQLHELAEKARHEKAVRDADRAARRADYEQARNESRKAERARNAVVTCEVGEDTNSCPTPSGGSSGGTDGGSSGGRIVPNRSFVATPPSASSPLRGSRGDEAAVLGAARGKSASARASEGTARDDRSSADSRPAREGSGPGLRPQGGSNGGDEFEWLAQELAKVDARFEPRLLVRRFLDVANRLGLSAQVMEEAAAWWIQGFATTFKTHNEVANSGGYLYQVLEDLAQAYVAARARQAEELGLDPASFNLCDWLLGQDEAAARAEREMEAADMDAADTQGRPPADSGELSKVSASDGTSAQAASPSPRELFTETLSEAAMAIAAKDGLSEGEAERQALVQVQGIGGYPKKRRELERLLATNRRSSMSDVECPATNLVADA